MNDLYEDWARGFRRVRPGTTEDQLKALFRADFPEVKPADPAARERGDMGRGFEIGARQIPMLAGGTAAMGGALIENAMGAGGVGTALKEWGLRKYGEWQQSIEPVARETDSLSASIERAKQGDFGALVDWAQYGVGYLGAQVAENVAVFAAGSLLGSLAGGPGAGTVAGAGGAVVAKEAAKGLIRGQLEKMVAKEAAQITAASGGRVAGEAALAQATKRVAGNVGGAVATGAYNVLKAQGGIYPEAVEEAQRAGRELDSGDLARITMAGAAVGAVESLTDLLGLGAVTGRIKMPGSGGTAARASVGAGVGAAGEGLTEFTQTVIERYGAGKPLTGDEARREYVDAAGLGALGGGLVGGAAGALNRPAPSTNNPALPDPAAEQQPGQPLLALPPPVYPMGSQPSLDADRQRAIMAAEERVATLRAERDAEEQRRGKAMQDAVGPWPALEGPVYKMDGQPAADPERQRALMEAEENLARLKAERDAEEQRRSGAMRDQYGPWGALAAPIYPMDGQLSANPEQQRAIAEADAAAIQRTEDRLREKLRVDQAFKDLGIARDVGGIIDAAMRVADPGDGMARTREQALQEVRQAAEMARLRESMFEGTGAPNEQEARGAQAEARLGGMDTVRRAAEQVSDPDRMDSFAQRLEERTDEFRRTRAEQKAEQFRETEQDKVRAEIDKAMSKRDAEREKAKGADLERMQGESQEERLQAEIARARAAGGDTEAKSALALEMERAGINPNGFPKEPVAPDVRAASDVGRRMSAGLTGQLPDAQLQMAAKAGEAKIASSAKRELTLREKMRKTPDEKAATRVAKRLFGGQPVSGKQLAFATRMGWGTVDKAGEFKLTRKGQLARAQVRRDGKFVGKGTTDKVQGFIGTSTQDRLKIGKKAHAKALRKARLSGRLGLGALTDDQREFVARAIQTLVDRVPMLEGAVDRLSAIGTHVKPQTEGNDAQVVSRVRRADGELVSQSLTFATSFLDEAMMGDETDWMSFVGVVAHELWHVIDFNGTGEMASATDPRFEVEVETDPGIALVVDPDADIMAEALTAYQRSTAINEALYYPIVFSAKGAHFVRTELFAQLGRLYTTNRELMAAELPLALQLFREIEANGKVQSAGRAVGEAGGVRTTVQASVSGRDGDERSTEQGRPAGDRAGSNRQREAAEGAGERRDRDVRERVVVSGSSSRRANPQVNTPEFKRWFGDSKVVDASGQPLLVYHGTDADIEAFDLKKAAEGSFGKGFYFTTSPEAAGRYAGERAGANVMPVYLSIKNPATLAQYLEAGGDRKKLARRGFDGLKLELKRSDDKTVYVAFRPEQIKSATGNTGAFSRLDGDIRASRNETPGTPGFRRFSEGTQVVTDNDTESYDSGPVTFEAYHGTTHGEITRFRGDRGNMEGFLGKGSYFTTSPDDASANYAGVGPDLAGRIEREEERVADEWADDAWSEREGIREYMEAMGIEREQGESEGDLLVRYTDDARAWTAEQRLKGDTDGFLMPVWVRMDNPLDLRPGKQYMEMEYVYEDPDNPESDIVDVAGPAGKMIEALRSVAGEWGVDVEPAIEKMNDGIYAFDLFEELGKADIFADPDGDPAGSGQFIQEVARLAGYDGLVMDADYHFGTGRRGPFGMRMAGMAGVNPGTLHLMPFRMGNIKSSTGNSGEFDRTNEDIRASRGEARFYSALTRAVEGAPAKALPAAGWKDFVRAQVNKGAVKAGEVEWSGLMDWLDMQQGKVERDAVKGYLDASGVQVEEKVLGGDAPDIKRLEAERDRLENELADILDEYAVAARKIRKSPSKLRRMTFWGSADGIQASIEDGEFDAALAPIAQRAADVMLKSNRIDREMRSGRQQGVMYERYNLPGGDRKREILLKLPMAEGSLTDVLVRFVSDADAEDFMVTLSAQGLEYLNYGALGNAAAVEFLGIADSDMVKIKALADEATGVLGVERDNRRDDATKAYISSHWRGEPNVLAHIRVNDRTDADGKRVLFVEEIQSDWAQEGRKKGFEPSGPEAKAEADRMEALRKEHARYRELAQEGIVETRRLREFMRSSDYNNATQAQQDDVRDRFERAIERQTELIAQRAEIDTQLSRAEKPKVPVAPFVTKTDAWLNLALKRTLLLAAEEGYDKVAFIDGKKSAERYSLSGVAGSLHFFDENGLRTFMALPEGANVDNFNGAPVFEEDGVSEERLRALIGDEYANELLAQPVTMRDGMDRRSLTDLSVNVGARGRGMIRFYDEVVPNTLNKLVKKLGTKVEPIDMRFGENEEVESTQLGFVVTPEVRAIAESGLPLFARGETWFSALRRAVETSQTNAAPAAGWKQFISSLPKKGLAKPEEIEWTGIMEWLDIAGDMKLKKEQLLRYLGEQGVQLEEVKLSGEGGDSWDVSVGEPETDEPDVMYLQDVARDSYLDDAKAQIAEDEEIDVEEVDEKQAMDLAYEMAKDAYYDDPDGPSTAPAYAENDAGDTERFSVEYGHGDLRIWSDSAGEHIYDGSIRRRDPKEIIKEWLLENRQLGGDDGPTEYSDYRAVVGGENYTELLLKLYQPNFSTKTVLRGDILGRIFARMEREGIATSRGDYSDDALERNANAEERALLDRIEAMPDRPRFNPPHFSNADAGNAVAHVRFDERYDVDFRKVLFLQEIQSDWAQGGREDGFKLYGAQGKAAEERLNKMRERRSELRAEHDRYYPEYLRISEDYIRAKAFDDPNGAARTAEEEAELARLEKLSKESFSRVEAISAELSALATNIAKSESAGIAPAPFVTRTDSWTALVLKRMIRHAAENGFDRIAWTTGEQQVQNYESALRKRVEAIEWKKTKEGVHLIGRNANGISVVDTTEKEDKLSAAIGKSMAEQIINDPEQEGLVQGDDITISSTGMLAFYEGVVPKVANDLLKKLGGEKVKTVALRSPGDTNSDTLYTVRRPDGSLHWGADGRIAQLRAFEAREVAREVFGSYIEAVVPPLQQPGFDITPKMKEEALKGLPLFARKQVQARRTDMPIEPPRVSDREHVSRVRRALSRRFGKGFEALEKAGIVKVVRSINELPPKSRKGMFATDEAIYHDGVAYLIAPNIPAGREVPILIHEIGEHYGLPRMIGDKRYAQVLDQLKGMKNRAAVKRAYDHVRRNYAKLEVEGEVFMSEVLARLSEDAAFRETPLWKRIVQSVRRFLFSVGMPVKFSEDEMAALVAASAHRAMRVADAGNAPRGLAQAARRWPYGGPDATRAPITPDDLSDDWLAMVPDAGGWKRFGVKPLPIRFEDGIAPESHKGYGLKHALRNAEENERREPRKATGDFAEDAAREVVAVLRSAKLLDKNLGGQGTGYWIISPAMKKAVVITEVEDGADGAYYRVVTVRPVESMPRSSVPVGSLAFPTPVTLQRGTSTPRGPQTAGDSQRTTEQGREGTEQVTMPYPDRRVKEQAAAAPAPQPAPAAGETPLRRKISLGADGKLRAVKRDPAASRDYWTTLLNAPKASETTIRFSVMFARDQYSPGEAGYADPDTLQWVEVEDYPISRLKDAPDAEWFQDEREMWSEEGDPERFDDMIDKEIHTPIVVYDDGSGGYIWDGNHRVGASVFSGKKTIKATVGISMQQPRASRRVVPEWAKTMPQGTQDALLKAGVVTEEKTWAERVSELKESFWQRVRQGVFDQYDSLKELDYDAYILARMSKASDQGIEALMFHGKPLLEDRALTVDESGGLGKVLGQLKGEHDRFMAWVAGNRAQQLKTEGRENLFTDQDISALKDLGTGNMPDGSSRAQLYTKVNREFQTYNKSVLDIAEQTGLIDGESRAIWEKDFYVPFFRVMEEGLSGPSVSSGLVNQKSFKKLKGGRENLNDLLANTLRNWAHLLQASMKNQAARASLDAADRLGIALEADEATARQMGKSTGNRRGVVSVLDQGVPRYYLVDDPQVLSAITAIEWAGFGGPAMDAMTAFKRWLTFGVTVNPTFRIRNLMRDAISAIAVTPLRYNPLGNVAEGWKATDPESAIRGKMLASGAIFRFGTMLEGNRADHARKQIERFADPKTILDSENKVKAMLLKAWEHYQEFGDRIENANRAAIYQQARARGLSHREAAFEARDLIDFSLQGQWPAIRFLTQVVPFMNARLQGLYKLGRGAVADSQRFGYVMGATTLATLALLAIYHDDEDWKKREDWDRDNFWWFKIGDTAYRIPKPFEIGAAATVAERFAEWTINEEPLAGKRMLASLGSIAMNNLSMNPTPQLVKPLIDLYANKEQFTGRPIETLGMERLSKDNRISAGTSQAARFIAGLDVTDRLSPVQIDYLLRSYFAWVGTASLTMLDEALRPVLDTEKPDRRLKEMFLVGNFVESLPDNGSRYVSLFYEQAKSVSEAHADWRNALKLGDLDEARRLRAENSEKINLQPRFADVQRVISDLNTRERQVRASETLSGETKRQLLDAIARRKDELAKRMVLSLPG